MEEYNHQKIEKKWQEIWEKKNFFQAADSPAAESKKPKYYVLVEFPYPSGAGLHVGHARSYVALDIVARKKRKQGFNVLFPMGWDAFGLPTENYAVKTGIHPSIVTKKNTEIFKRQQKDLGLSFDWSREINTSAPDYYKWTQWIFIQLFKNGLAYKAKMPINWCPSCKIGLANEEVIDGRCERCESEVEKKEKEQWMLKITNYADRLLDDLDKVDYPERVKTAQREWIGKSQGAEIQFKIQNSEFKINVFTTRPDTLFGCTYIILSPEHNLVSRLREKIGNYKEVEKYIKVSMSKAERDRTENKDKTGIELKGVKATNPVNNRKIPVFVADYVLSQYGTGAIMAVPAHDQRDFDFARKYNLPIIKVIEKGRLVNSGKFTGLDFEKAQDQIMEWFSKRNCGGKKINYKLRDWIFSRQRYWGEPIPLVFCKNCGWVAVPEKDLPVELPKIKDFKPGKKGESPLAKVKSWVNVKCQKCGKPAERETDVMPNWAGSNWYYLRYCDPKNNKEIADPKKLKYWLPVDWYNGGMEHITLHLLYSRFIYKFLWDIGAVPKIIGPEPYKKRTSHGIILGQGSIKMSKSKGNVINPDEIIKRYGADALRIYEMFMGPFEQMIPWDDKGLKGARRFLQKVWQLSEKFPIFRLAGGQANSKSPKNSKLEKLINKTIKKVGEDIESLKFNTAVSSLMILANELEKQKEIPLTHYSLFLILLNPFAPHISEELWSRVGLKGSCFEQKWPEYDSGAVKEKKINLIIQINGRVRDKIEVDVKISKKEAERIALKSSKIKKWLVAKKIKKTIFVPGRLINFAIDKE